MNLYKSSIALCAVLLAISASAQDNSFMSDANGRPFYTKTDYIADGSPYLFDEYRFADVTSVTGKVYSDILAKFNIAENLLLFKINGSEFAANTLISKIRFKSVPGSQETTTDVTIQSVDTAVNVSGVPVYVLIWKGAQSQLLKRLVVSYSDQRAYGESAITRSFKINETYFAHIPAINKQPLKFSRNKSDVAAVFGTFSEQILHFINDKKVNCKSDKALSAVFAFYEILLVSR